MGILRSDRVSGLDGANAINGSVFFGSSLLYSGRSSLTVTNTSELDIGNGNFTIEYWFNCGNTSDDEYSASLAQSEYNGSSSNTAFNIYHYVQGIRIFNRISGGYSSLYNTSSLWTADTWHHFAWVREGTGSNENKIYIDGTLAGSAFTNAANYTAGQHWIIGSNMNGGFGTPEYGFSGYLSNVRVSNTARYTANFTTPTARLEKDVNTIILACQSPGNILKEETGKTLTTYAANTNSDPRYQTAPPMASHISPDVGEDHGTTFADNTKFDTLSYMVPPGGRTRDRYLKSTGDIVSGNLIWHIDAGNPTSYAGVTTSGTTIYDLQGGTGVSAVGIATLASGHSSWPAPGWTPDNGGAWYLGSDSTTASNYTGQLIIMPDHSLGNDNYTINAWVKLKYYSENSGNYSFIVSNKDGGPVSFHAHIKKVSGQGRIGAGAYYSSWSYDYASGADENTMIALNKWYMLTWVNTAQYTQSMYVNGVIQKLNGGAYTWNSRTSNNTPVNSVAGYGTNEETNAWIGQIQHYNDTLTAAEILQNYNVHKCRYDQ